MADGEIRIDTKVDNSGAEKGLKELGGKVSSLGGTAFSKLGSAAATGLKVATAAIGAATTAVAGFGASAVKVGMEFDSAMSQVEATMGDKAHQMVEYNGETIDSMEALRDFAQEMGSTTAFSATQASEALNYMALAGYDATTSMETLPSVLNLAAAGDMELSRASDMVTDALSALGKDADYAQTMVDQMAATSSNSNTSVAQLGEAILTVGANAKQLAGGTTELNTVLGLLANNGTKGAEGGTRLRNIMLALGSPIDKAKESLDALGVSAYDSEGNMRPLQDTINDLNKAMSNMTQEQKNNTLNTIFNKVDLADVNYLLDLQAEDWNNLSSAVDHSGYSFTDFQKQLSKVGVEFDDLSQMSEKLGVSTDTLTWAFENAQGSAEFFVDALYENGSLESTDEILKAMGVDLDTLQTAFDNTSGAAQTMADAQLDNLAGDITLFKSALEGAQIIISDGLAPSLRDFVQFGTDGLQRLTEAFKEGGMSGAMDEFSKLLTEGIDMLMGMLPQLVEAGSQLLNAIIQGIVDNLDVLIDATIQIATTIGNAIIENAPLLFDAAIQILDALLQGIVDNLDVIIEATISIIDMIGTSLMENAPMLMEAALEIIFQLGQSLIDNLPDLIDATVEIILFIVDALLDNLDKLIDAALQLIVALAEGLIRALPKLLDKAPIIIERLVKAIVKEIPRLIAAALQLIIALADGLIQNIPRLLLAVPELIAALVSGIGNGVADLIEVGGQLIDGLWDGIKNSWSKMVERVKGLAKDLVQSVKDIFEIKSPSKKFRYIGEMCVAGLDEPLEDYNPYETVEKSFQASTGSLQASFAGGMSNMSVDTAGVGAEVRNALSGMAVMIDGRTAGQLLAGPVNNALGVISARRT